MSAPNVEVIARAKKVEFSFNLLEFTFFYLVYSPLWFLIIISSIIRAYTKRKGPQIDWKS
jgi:hypothetical protein